MVSWPTKLCNAVADSCNVLGAWHLSANAPPSWVVSLWCVRLLPSLLHTVGLKTLHATTSFIVLDVPPFEEGPMVGGN